MSRVGFVIFIIICLSICFVHNDNIVDNEDDDELTKFKKPTPTQAPTFTQTTSTTQKKTRSSNNANNEDKKLKDEKKIEEKEELFAKRRTNFDNEELNELLLKLKLHEQEQEMMDKKPEILSSYHSEAMRHIPGDYKKAIALLEKAAKANNPQSLYELGRLYEYGYGVEMNFTIALEYYKKSASFGNEKAQRSLGFFYDTGKGTKIDKSMSLLYYTFAAENYDLEASHVLAYKYSKGYDVVKSCSTAYKFIKRVATQVIDDINTNYFDISPYYYIDKLEEYIQNGDVESSQEEIINLIVFSAVNGDVHSMVEVGFWYLQGVYGFEKNYRKAKEYFEQAVDEQNGKAMALLGFMYERGYGVSRDIDKAADLYERSANLNTPIGLNFLGEMYLNGKGKMKSYDKALSHFKRAVGGYPPAASNLGKMYFHGYGVPKNYETAIQYFRIAANSDNAEGLYYLGVSLNYGLGIVEDCGASVEYLKKVAYHGPFKADYKTALLAFEDENFDRSLLIYEKMAERGFEVAQSNAGWIYDANLQSKQFGVSDTDLHNVFALKYYRRSADLGNTISHLKLGDYYYYGKGGLSVDHSKAVSYYRHISAINAQAKYNLGYMHHFGEGIARDLFLAKRFYDSSLETDPNAFIPVTLSLILLGFDYSLEMFENGNYFQLITEAIDYFVPEIFFSPLPTTTTAPTQNTDPKKTTAEENSVWDSETIFGYNLDTVVIFVLVSILFIAMLIRHQVIQFQV